MKNSPVCNSNSTFAFDTNYVKVHKCHNTDCSHLFAVDTLPFRGVHDFSKDEKEDFTVYNERNIHLIDYLKRNNILKPNGKILDFGSGSGHVLQSLKNSDLNLDITAVEYNESYHENLNKIGCKALKTLDNIDPNEKFDLILFIEVIEHLDDPITIIAKLKSLLKEGGKIFLTTPAGNTRSKIDNIKQLYAYEMEEHVQFFSEKSLEYCLKKVGFKKISYKYINSMYPNKGFNSFAGKLNVLKGYYSHMRGYTIHLTYIAS